MSRQVVVTGIGMVTPLGNNCESTWRQMMNGQSGIDLVSQFDTEGFETRIAGEVKGFTPEDYMEKKEVRRTDRFAQFALAAASQALEEAQLSIGADIAEETVVYLSSGIGGLNSVAQGFESLGNRGPSRVSAFLAPMMLPDMAAGMISIRFGIKGPSMSITSACASGADALGMASTTIRNGDAKVAVAGGADACITPIAIAAFNACGALSHRNDQPTRASRPFDAERDGFVMAEGAAVLILEDREFACSRGATILAELVGYGATSDAYHITQPAERGEGGARAIKLALKRAGLEPEEIGYVNAHGTSTLLNDKYETMALKSALGAHSYQVPISSTKSMMGHTLGAAGAIEAAICVLAIQRGEIPPTTNLDTPDADCDLDYISKGPRIERVKATLSNSFGFGGHNAALIFSEPRIPTNREER